MEKVRYSAFGLSEDLFTWLAKITRHCLVNGLIEMPGLAEGAEVDDYLLVEHLRLCSEQGTLRCTEADECPMVEVLVGNVELWVDGYTGEMVDFLLDTEWEDFGLVFDDVAPDGDDADGVEVDAAPPASPVLVDMNDALE